jgi:hypothetical protein
VRRQVLIIITDTSTLDQPFSENKRDKRLILKPSKTQRGRLSKINRILKQREDLRNLMWLKIRINGGT